MADSNETQRLNDLLGEIALQDAHLEAPHLEARVISSAEAALTNPRAGSKSLRYLTIAAAVAAVLAPALYLMNPAPAVNTSSRQAPPSEQVTASPDEVVVARPPSTAAPARSVISTSSPSDTRRTRRSRPERPTIPAGAFASDEFVPLMPMTDYEMAGPFQLVRVQMPRASLGPLRSPLDRPNELIEADVLLGEDGMARAIRVSTSESVYPRRFR
jgi:hypothetical protein